MKMFNHESTRRDTNYAVAFRRNATQIFDIRHSDFVISEDIRLIRGSL